MKVQLKIKVFWEPIKQSDEVDDEYVAKLIGKEPAPRKPLADMDQREVTIYDVSSITPYYDDIGKKWYSLINSYGTEFIVPHTYEAVQELINANVS
jgi:hypothetical protein